MATKKKSTLVPIKDRNSNKDNLVPIKDRNSNKDNLVPIKDRNPTRNKSSLTTPVIKRRKK